MYGGALINVCGDIDNGSGVRGNKETNATRMQS